MAQNDLSDMAGNRAARLGTVTARQVGQGIRLWVIVACLALTGGLVASTVARADDAAPVVVTGDDTIAQPWAVNCTSSGDASVLSCVMSQVLLAKQTGQRVGGVSLFRPQPGAAAEMRVSLPHGISLPDGVDVGIDDGQQTKHVIAVADQNGSYSQFNVGADLIAALEGGTSLVIGVNAADGKRIVFRLSLKGFIVAFAKI